MGRHRIDDKFSRLIFADRGICVGWRILIPPCGGSNPPAPASKIKHLQLLRFQLMSACRHLVGTAPLNQPPVMSARLVLGQ